MDENNRAQWVLDFTTDRMRVDFLVGLVALDTGIPPPQIWADRRSAEATKARQMALYLSHVAFGWPLHRVGRAFGRDRSTISHACHLVENLRGDRGIDARLSKLEACLKAAPVASTPVPV